ncbi:hypothetical protein BBBOND_0306010 [Babesia bigemina]|uniref:Uncharacterized protein n=1 Tax=Babesia bigemina TaxID=5866 RepID=A0A061D9P2_BABBI|nr:hypothetical protein BBBOND_0306010 [Babesia bigemina]CDR96697.1 hypothetical protein BBBOND_0306010 [Babesia bigemina]|eukprot:XP_012768883.1 hypothetical protein BBBOND_0306010 [Babesia bigemina]
MAKFRNMTPLEIFCAICLYCLRGIDASVCDFGGPDQLLGQNDLAICHKYADFLKFETVICPRHVDGTEYAWHPQSTSADHYSLFKAYIGANYRCSSRFTFDNSKLNKEPNLLPVEMTLSLIMRIPTLT